ncbi:MAG: hypothetical protein R3E01_15175 [Pirellulaceae bacterium]|nr:hypothetical protein [Planctomycetales bacterium]
MQPQEGSQPASQPQVGSQPQLPHARRQQRRAFNRSSKPTRQQPPQAGAAQALAQPASHPQLGSHAAAPQPLPQPLAQPESHPQLGSQAAAPQPLPQPLAQPESHPQLGSAQQGLQVGRQHIRAFKRASNIPGRHIGRQHEQQLGPASQQLGAATSQPQLGSQPQPA